jgi:peptidoglycan biosynthesis protein MviN/MurJ (putative lipid II flippase)
MFYHQNPNPYLVASTLTFLAPLSIAVQLNDTHTQAAFTFLLVASTAYHATKHPVLYYIDQIAANYLVIRSFLDGYRGGAASLAISISVNLTCIYLYMYGRKTQSLIWSPSFEVATATHAFMHCLVAAGYSCLLYVAKGTDREPIQDGADSAKVS